MKIGKLDPIDKAWLDTIMPENDEFTEILGIREARTFGLNRNEDITLGVDVVIRESLAY